MQLNLGDPIKWKPRQLTYTRPDGTRLPYRSDLLIKEGYITKEKAVQYLEMLYDDENTENVNLAEFVLAGLWAKRCKEHEQESTQGVPQESPEMGICAYVPTEYPEREEQ
jgi:hypothetical protein